MEKYKPTIGLEIHAELNTETKMFCSCKNDPDQARPNVNICPVCMAHPGTLPVINKQAVKNVLKVGLAIGSNLAGFTEFDRKNYFYPDIPKGYQISQYKYPLVSGGRLAGVDITRIHLEEDTASSSHSAEGSLVNFNRAGVPLMELVTEPVIHSSSEAVKFGKELQLLLQYLGVAEANMEKGEVRFEANISVSDTDKLGTKVEVKNLNSFRSAEKAIEYEIKRQIEVLESGGKVAQETRGFDEAKQTTFSQRSKEDSHDYRYFPDPDLPKLDLREIPEFSKDALTSEIPETPQAKRERYALEFGLKDSDIEFYINNTKLANLFEKSAKLASEAGCKNLQLVSNYIVSDISSFDNWEDKVSPESVAELIVMIEKGEVSSRGAKDIINIMVTNGGNPRDIAEANNLFQKTDKGEIVAIIKVVLEANPKVVEEYKAGKVALLQFLVGQAMKASKGAGNPALIKELLLEELN